MLLLCVVMLIFYNRTSAKNPDFRQKSAQNTENPLKKHFFTFIPLYFAFRPHPHSSSPTSSVSVGANH